MDNENLILKKALRKELLTKRELIYKDYGTDFSKRIQKSILSLDEYKLAESLLIYIDYCNEVITKTIIEESFKLNKKVYVPKICSIDSEKKMIFFRLNSFDDLCVGYKGILEPTNENNPFIRNDNAIIICPGVGFDLKGNRLGYGKGFYDSYLKDMDNITKVGICFDVQIVDELITESHDIKMNYIITESSVNKIY